MTRIRYVMAACVATSYVSPPSFMEAFMARNARQDFENADCF